MLLQGHCSDCCFAVVVVVVVVVVTVQIDGRPGLNRQCQG